MAEPHTIETYGPQPNNRNIWPHNSRGTAAPSRLTDSFVCFSIGSIPTTYVFIIMLIITVHGIPVAAVSAGNTCH